MRYDARDFLEGLYDTPGAGRPAPPTVQADLRVEDLPGDRRVEWEERASILEYCGGLLRERAEAIALTEMLRKMLRDGDFPPT